MEVVGVEIDGSTLTDMHPIRRGGCKMLHDSGDNRHLQGRGRKNPHGCMTLGADGAEDKADSRVFDNSNLKHK